MKRKWHRSSKVSPICGRRAERRPTSSASSSSDIDFVLPLSVVTVEELIDGADDGALVGVSGVMATAGVGVAAGVGSASSVSDALSQSSDTSSDAHDRLSVPVFGAVSWGALSWAPMVRNCSGVMSVGLGRVGRVGASMSESESESESCSTHLSSVSREPFGAAKMLLEDEPLTSFLRRAQ